MADNFVANSGSGGKTFRTDDVGGVDYPVSKLDAGGDGVSVPIVAGQQTMANSIPVVLPTTQLPTAAATGDSLSNPTVSKIATFPYYLDENGFWNRQKDNSLNTYALNTLVALSDAAEVETNGKGTVRFTLTPSSFVGTIVFEGKLSNASSYLPVKVLLDDDTIVSSIASWGSAFGGSFVAAGYRNLRLRVSAYTSGSVTAYIESSRANSVIAVGKPLPTGTNIIGNVGNIPLTSGGLSVYAFLSTAAVISAAIKASAGQVYSLQFFNLNAAARYVRLYNMTTAPATTDTPIWRGIIPGNTAGAGFVIDIHTGLAFGTGIGIRVTAAIADNDATVLAANEIIGNVLYK